MRKLSVALLLLFVIAPVDAGSDNKKKPDEVAPSASKLGLKAYESEHYRLETDANKIIAQEYLNIMEAEWPQLVEFFEKKPQLAKNQKLVVNFLTTQQLWHKKLKEDGVGIPFGAGGYYTPQTSAVYFYRQPTVYNTRQLLIHEVMHQFHYLACCNNRKPADVWYIEGIVEHLSRHNWNGEMLELGAVPLVTLANYPKQALKLFKQEDYSLAGMVDSTRQSARPEQWALVHYLLTEQSGKYLSGWDKLRSKLDQHQKAGKWFRKFIGDPAKLQPKILKWLEEEQEPFVYLWNEWEARGFDEVTGWAKVTSGIATREDVDMVSCHVDVPKTGAWAGGILLDYVDNKDYTVGHIRSNGEYTISRMTINGWARMRSGKYNKAAGQKLKLKAKRIESGDVEYWVNDKLIETIPVNGKRMGFCLENCRLVFTGLDWQ
ncbi:MAG: hypothetical protein ACYTDT_05805 [Planctomycetota bacterium]|jgi:hypothetical protein